MTCKNCQSIINGKFCHTCGEKRVSADDFTIKTILAQAFDSIMNLDSKLFRSLFQLFFKPGQLSKNYIEGLRVPFMKPFQLFVFANLIFFLFLNDTDIFRTPSKWFFVEDFDGIQVMDKVRSIAEEKKISIREVARIYDKKSSNLSKLLTIVFIPVISLIGFLFHLRKKVKIAIHTIFSIHYFSFMLLSIVLFNSMLDLLNENVEGWMYILPVTILITVYYIIAIKHFYQNNWLSASLKGIASVFLINLFVQFYRLGINVLTLSSI